MNEKLPEGTLLHGDVPIIPVGAYPMRKPCLHRWIEDIPCGDGSEDYMEVIHGASHVPLSEQHRALQRQLVREEWGL